MEEDWADHAALGEIFPALSEPEGAPLGDAPVALKVHVRPDRDQAGRPEQGPLDGAGEFFAVVELGAVPEDPGLAPKLRGEPLFEAGRKVLRDPQAARRIPRIANEYVVLVIGEIEHRVRLVRMLGECGRLCLAVPPCAVLTACHNPREMPDTSPAGSDATAEGSLSRTLHAELLSDAGVMGSSSNYPFASRPLRNATPQVFVPNPVPTAGLQVAAEAAFGWVVHELTRDGEEGPEHVLYQVFNIATVGPDPPGKAGDDRGVKVVELVPSDLAGGPVVPLPEEQRSQRDAR